MKSNKYMFPWDWWFFDLKGMATVIFAAVLKTDFLMGKTEQHRKLLMTVIKCHNSQFIFHRGRVNYRKDGDSKCNGK